MEYVIIFKNIIKNKIALRHCTQTFCNKFTPKLFSVNKNFIVYLEVHGMEDIHVVKERCPPSGSSNRFNENKKYIYTYNILILHLMKHNPFFKFFL